MNARIQHSLVIALFALVHLVVQPLAAAASCMGAEAGGGDCCCSSVEAAPAASSGCCSDPEEPSDSDGGHSDSLSAHSSCQCSVAPPVPFAPESDQPTPSERGQGFEALAAGQNPLFSSVWPSLAVRAARPPCGQPPWVARKAAPAFTQVFRL